MDKDTVVFSHGKESGPWGTKINAMAAVARRKDMAVESIDYRHINDPGERVKTLVTHFREFDNTLVLVGSSMGGHVAASAAHALQPAGLFLIAPAFYMPGYEDLTPEPIDRPTVIVHGWHDDVVPVDNSIRYARNSNVVLYLLDGDHRLTARIAHISRLFEIFLDQIAQGF